MPVAIASNVDKRPWTRFVKAYMHNASLLRRRASDCSLVMFIGSAGASNRRKRSEPEAASQKPSVDQKGVRVRIINGPSLESATSLSAVIRWTTNGGGGTITHYGMVHYGTVSHSISNTDKRPIGGTETCHIRFTRVNVDRLKPGTTYNYTVGSTQTGGVDAEVRSSVNHFTIGP